MDKNKNVNENENETRKDNKTVKTTKQRIISSVFMVLISVSLMSGLASADNSTVNFSKIIDLMEEMPSVIAPIADIIAEMIVIMAYLAVAGLIIGIFSGIVMWIQNSFAGFKFK